MDTPDFYVILVGTSTNKVGKIDNKFSSTVNDVILLAQTLEDVSTTTHAKITVVKLVREDAIRTRILDELDAVAVASTSNDTFIFFFSGHGGWTTSADAEGDDDDDDQTDSGDSGSAFIVPLLDRDSLYTKLSAIKAARIIVLLNCTHAAGVSTNDIVYDPYLSVEQINTFGDETGITVVTSAQIDQLSYTSLRDDDETDRKRYSVFALGIRHALLGRNRQQAGDVRVCDLVSGCYQYVEKMTALQQNPCIVFRGHDNFAIATLQRPHNTTPVGIWPTGVVVVDQPQRVTRSSMINMNGGTVYAGSVVTRIANGGGDDEDDGVNTTIQTVLINHTHNTRWKRLVARAINRHLPLPSLTAIEKYSITEVGHFIRTRFETTEVDDASIRKLQNSKVDGRQLLKMQTLNECRPRTAHHNSAVAVYDLVQHIWFRARTQKYAVDQWDRCKRVLNEWYENPTMVICAPPNSGKSIFGEQLRIFIDITTTRRVSCVSMCDVDFGREEREPSADLFWQPLAGCSWTEIEQSNQDIFVIVDDADLLVSRLAQRFWACLGRRTPHLHVLLLGRIGPEQFLYTPLHQHTLHVVGLDELRLSSIDDLRALTTRQLSETDARMVLRATDGHLGQILGLLCQQWSDVAVHLTSCEFITSCAQPALPERDTQILVRYLDRVHGTSAFESVGIDGIQIVRFCQLGLVTSTGRYIRFTSPLTRAVLCRAAFHATMPQTAAALGASPLDHIARLRASVSYMRPSVLTCALMDSNKMAVQIEFCRGLCQTLPHMPFIMFEIAEIHTGFATGDIIVGGDLGWTLNIQLRSAKPNHFCVSIGDNDVTLIR
ncbi:hypothetical protein BC936DRAFT_148693 [Jimgerdemannia flammicorona]|uniref:Peptidase C14 caspase domain-containing protein n=1 Tax=Jimgerdemannia flammicorona TaxID=994334 RepID=A0A433DN79_9FUNG|nr:hypothetical protein BC936DRAFT_148693 [Jimgerdemannia flammicorona]